MELYGADRALVKKIPHKGSGNVEDFYQIWETFFWGGNRHTLTLHFNFNFRVGHSSREKLAELASNYYVEIIC